LVVSDDLVIQSADNRIIDDNSRFLTGFFRMKEIYIKTQTFKVFVHISRSTSLIFDFLLFYEWSGSFWVQLFAGTKYKGILDQITDKKGFLHKINRINITEYYIYCTQISQISLDGE